jgi:hypothetical protein
MLSRFGSLARAVNSFRSAAPVLARTAMHTSSLHFDSVEQPPVHVINRSFSTESLRAFDKFKKPSTIEICKEVNTPEVIKVCKEAAALLGLDAKEFHETLAAFFIQGNETMKGNYNNSVLSYAIGMKNGITKAITFTDDKEKTKEELRASYKKGITYRDCVKIWDFGNLTGRASHLYGLEEEGFFTYRDVKDLVEKYNRFGLRGKDEDSTFQLLTRKETRALIRTGKMTPLDALFLSEQLREDRNADNVLKDVYHNILSSNHKRSSALGMTG